MEQIASQNNLSFIKLIKLVQSTNCLFLIFILHQSEAKSIGFEKNWWILSCFFYIKLFIVPNFY